VGRAGVGVAVSPLLFGVARSSGRGRAAVRERQRQGIKTYLTLGFGQGAARGGGLVTMGCYADRSGQAVRGSSVPDWPAALAAAAARRGHLQGRAQSRRQLVTASPLSISLVLERAVQWLVRCLMFICLINVYI
jgi:hypothetical protein